MYEVKYGKKIISMVLFMATAFSIAACGDNEDLQAQIDALQTKIERQEERLEQQKEVIGVLEDENEELSNKITELENEKASLENKNEKQAEELMQWKKVSYTSRFEFSISMEKTKFVEGEDINVEINLTDTLGGTTIEYFSLFQPIIPTAKSVVESELRQEPTSTGFLFEGASIKETQNLTDIADMGIGKHFLIYRACFYINYGRSDEMFIEKTSNLIYFEIVQKSEPLPPPVGIETIVAYNASTNQPLAKEFTMQQGEEMQVYPVVTPTDLDVSSVKFHYNLFCNISNYGIFVNIDDNGKLKIAEDAPVGVEILMTISADGRSTEIYKITIVEEK